MTTVTAFSLGAVVGSWGCWLVGRWAERRRIRRVNAAFEAKLRADGLLDWEVR